MKEDVKKLQEQRMKLYSDFFNNKLPEWVPMEVTLGTNIVGEYGGGSPIDFQYDYSKLYEPAMELADMVYSDKPITNPVGIIGRPPSFYQSLDSQSFVMGNNGFVQHPEVVGMMDDEYDQLIEDPYAFLWEVVLPRQYKNLDLSDPVNMLISYEMSKMALQADTNASLPMFMDLIEKKGYYPGAPMTASGFAEAPFDFIADQLRSFSGISKDVRRHRTEIKEACEALLPLIFYWGLPATPHPEGFVGTPLHMPTYMRPKDFEELWFPTYKTMVEQWASLGARTMAFCEDDWMRYLDHLRELPAGTILWFEYADPKLVKEKLGDKFILQGMYPITLIKTGTKQQCLDKAKELLDIMMPGGGYIFSFDKAPLTLNDINMENYAAVTQFVHEYGRYDNPGDAYGMPLNSEGFVRDESIIGPYKSKYHFDWDAFKAKFPLAPDSARARFEQYDQEILSHIMFMCI